MNMWKPFRNSPAKNAQNAHVVFDKFQIMRHFGDALDEVRRPEYHRLEGKLAEIAFVHKGIHISK